MSAQQTANNAGYFSARELGYQSYQLSTWEKKYNLVPMRIGSRYFYRREDVAAIAKRDGNQTSPPVSSVPASVPAPAPRAAVPKSGMVKVYIWGKVNEVKHPTVSGWCQDGKISSALKDSKGVWFADAAELAAYANSTKHLRGGFRKSPRSGAQTSPPTPVATVVPQAEPDLSEMKKIVHQWVKLHSQARLQQLNVANPTPAQENLFNREIYTELKRRYGMRSEDCKLNDLLARIDLLSKAQLGVSF